MKRSVWLNILLMAAFLGAIAASPRQVNASELQPVVPPEGNFVPGQVVVLFEEGLSSKAYAAQTSALASTVSAQVVGQNGRLALLGFDPASDVAALSAQIQALPGVKAAEPNYRYSIPYIAPDRSIPINRDYVTRVVKEGNQVREVKIAVSDLKAMRTIRNRRVTGEFPNDPYVWSGGYSVIHAEIIWTNTTASKNVCVLDTGVDYLHKDLLTKVIKGADFVNNDLDPMDDFGHGTQVAGVIVAVSNNAQGLTGISTGKVVAVKVLDSQGWGTNYEIALGILYCGARTDISVINMSFGGPDYSEVIRQALINATVTKGKLAVAAAGNANTDSKYYPAGYAEELDFDSRILSVAASGALVPGDDENEDGIPDWYDIDYDCRAEYSNYGSWVNVIAPGTGIYSTTPWDKPFVLNYYNGVAPRYDYMDGTSMAAPYVSGVAARTWGYKPLLTNQQIAERVQATGEGKVMDGACWPTSMSGVQQVNIARAMDRGAGFAPIFDASTRLPLENATVQLYKGTTLVATSKTFPHFATNSDGSTQYYSFASANFLNLFSPWDGAYTQVTPKVSKTGYTYGAQAAFLNYNQATQAEITPGVWNYLGSANVPPKNSSFTLTTAWLGWDDLDIIAELPELPKDPLIDDGQPGWFIVSPYYGLTYPDPMDDPAPYLEGDSTGNLTVFPFARWMVESGGDNQAEEIVIRSRPGNSYLPYYTGEYYVYVSDYGQWRDLNENGVHDPGEYSVLTTRNERSLFVWWNGKILKQVKISTDPVDECTDTNNNMWIPLSIYSGKTGTAPLIEEINQCFTW